jgi:hypothetical protein
MSVERFSFAHAELVKPVPHAPHFAALSDSGGPSRSVLGTSVNMATKPHGPAALPVAACVSCLKGLSPHTHRVGAQAQALRPVLRGELRIAVQHELDRVSARK